VRRRGSPRRRADGRCHGGPSRRLGSPEVTAREVAERVHRNAAELADECAEVAKGSAGLLSMFDDAAWNGPAGGGYEGTLGDGVEALWYDAWLHGNDIRSSLDRPADTGAGMRAALSMGANAPIDIYA